MGNKKTMVSKIMGNKKTVVKKIIVGVREQ